MASCFSIECHLYRRWFFCLRHIWYSTRYFCYHHHTITHRIRKFLVLAFTPLSKWYASLSRKHRLVRRFSTGIRKAARVESVLHSHIAARMIQEVREAKRKVPPAFAELTPRELEVLQLLADGQTNAAIAEHLVLSEKTVQGYVSNILSKLHLEDRTQVAVFAWQQGLMR